MVLINVPGFLKTWNTEEYFHRTLLRKEGKKDVVPFIEIFLMPI